MAWNDPGGRDPWGGNQGGGNPPDLDEALRKLKEKLFGGPDERAGHLHHGPLVRSENFSARHAQWLASEERQRWLAHFRSLLEQEQRSAAHQARTRADAPSRASRTARIVIPSPTKTWPKCPPQLWQTISVRYQSGSGARSTAPDISSSLFRISLRGRRRQER